MSYVEARGGVRRAEEAKELRSFISRRMPRSRKSSFWSIRPVWAGLLVVLLFTLSCTTDQEQGATPTVVNLALSPAGGSWFTIGGVLADVITDSAPGVRGIAEVTGGAVENVRLVGTGQSDLGFVILNVAQHGYRGQAPFNQAFPDLRMLFANFQIGRLHLVVNEDSPLESVCDVEGKRVAVGPSGHGSIPSLREIFSAGCGFTFEEISPVYLPYNQSLITLGDERVDAAVLYVAPPIAALSEFGATHPYRLLPMQAATREKIIATHPHYVEVMIPPGIYEQVIADVPLVGTSNGMVVNANLSDDVVYEILTATFENLDRLRDSHPTLLDFGLEAAARGGLIPFHDGAIRYYQDQGVWSEEEQTPSGGEETSAGTGEE